MEYIPSTKQVINEGVEKFKEIFHKEPKWAGYGPGRVEVIGGHTDYNEGLVLPMGLSMSTIVVGKENNLPICRVHTTSGAVGDDKNVEFPIPTEENPLKPGEPKWANYVKGVVANFEGRVVGFDAVIVTSVPLGGGLSSSASLEVATYTFLEAITGQKTDDLRTKAFLCQKAEHEFANVPCGIMDQFVSVSAKKDHALLIDCRSLKSYDVPVQNKEYEFVITNSNVRHDLSEGAYSNRRNLCLRVSQLLNKRSLRDVQMSELTISLENNIITEEEHKRARHVTSEIIRTQMLATALAQNDYVAVGKFMNQSHLSLSRDYEVSCPELNQLVKIAVELPDVLGSRMTGGGFGGCTITLVKKSKVEELVNAINEKYDGKATFYLAVPSGGARIISLEDINQIQYEDL